MKIRVLLADDHALMRDGLRALLAGAEDIEIVGTAANGREALQAIAGAGAEVVLMDISMPDLNGIEAARLILQRHPGTRVIMLSMHSSSEHVHQALSAGAIGYLLKDSAGEEVVAAVRAAHGGRLYLSRAIRHLEPRFPAGEPAPGPLASLSARERQVLQLVVEGRSSADIAHTVNLSPKTVETYRARLMKKLGVANVTELVKFAVRHGITPLG